MVGATAWGSTPFLFRQQGKVLSGYGLLGSLIDLGLDGTYMGSMGGHGVQEFIPPF